MAHPTYDLTLHKSYYDKGFFNLGVAVSRYVRPENGAVKLILGSSNRTIIGRVDRDANINGTPRIHGGSELRDWFFKNFRMKDRVLITILNSIEVRIDASEQ